MKKKSRSVSRRRFLLTAATAVVSAPMILQSAAKAAKPVKKLRHACIGVGGMGLHDLENFARHTNVEIVALCDVDENNLKKAAALLPGVRTYIDWREMFKKEKQNIDSV